ncbi:MAG: amidohydrolase [Woeseia sp.]|nr:amidohydrolase [Woeseia sp.]NNE60840.1 amidohydrolase [Woeseia sp.]NNL54557.1 amidohydrolase [Woeseia sp.]
MSPLSIAMIQADLHWHDAKANRTVLARSIERLEDGVDLVVLPEMFATGFTMDAPDQAETMDGATVDWLRETAQRHDAAVCGSLVIADGENYYNRFILMHANGDYQTYDKRHLFRLAGECDHYSAGDTLETLRVKDWRIRPLVCYDLRFPVWSRRSREHDYDLLLYVANWPSPRHQAWETLLRARAIENQCYVVGVNRVGTDGNDVPYAGGSAIIDFFGNELVKLDDQAGDATIALEPEPLQRFRERFPFDIDADTFAITGNTQDA